MPSVAMGRIAALAPRGRIDYFTAYVSQQRSHRGVQDLSTEQFGVWNCAIWDAGKTIGGC